MLLQMVGYSHFVFPKTLACPLFGSCFCLLMLCFCVGFGVVFLVVCACVSVRRRVRVFIIVCLKLGPWASTYVLSPFIFWYSRVGDRDVAPLIGKSSPCGGSGFPLPLFEWFYTICPTPYNRK